MPQYIIPPWLNPPTNRVESYAAGVNARQRASDAAASRSLQIRALNERSAQASAQREMQMRIMQMQQQQRIQAAQQQMQIRQEQEKRLREQQEQRAEMEKQKMEISKAYNESMKALRQAELEEKKRMNDQAIKEAADRAARILQYQSKQQEAKNQEEQLKNYMIYAPGLSKSGSMSTAGVSAAARALQPAHIPRGMIVPGTGTMMIEGSRGHWMEPRARESLSTEGTKLRLAQDRLKQLETSYPGLMWKDPSEMDPTKSAAYQSARAKAAELQTFIDQAYKYKDEQQSMDASAAIGAVRESYKPTGKKRIAISVDEKGNLVLPSDSGQAAESEQMPSEGENTEDEYDYVPFD